MIDKKEQVIECVLDNKPILQCAQNEYFRLSRGFFSILAKSYNFSITKIYDRKKKKNPSGALIRKGFFDSIIET